MKIFMKLISVVFVVLVVLFFIKNAREHAQDWQYEKAYECAVQEMLNNLQAPTETEYPNFSMQYVVKKDLKTMEVTVEEYDVTLDVETTTFDVSIPIATPNMFGVKLSGTYSITVAVPNDKASNRFWVWGESLQ